MGSRESKARESLSLKELPVFFRNMALRLEALGGDSSEMHEDDLSDFTKIRIEVKREGDRARLKIKVKRDAPGWDAPSAGTLSVHRPTGIKYGTLKKRMDKTFRKMGQDLAKGLVPADETRSAYLEDVDRMVSFPGKGSPFYEKFKKACTSFRDACEKEDVASARSKYESMAQLKAECHDRFK